MTRDKKPLTVADLQKCRDGFSKITPSQVYLVIDPDSIAGKELYKRGATHHTPPTTSTSTPSLEPPEPSKDTD